ncbi:MFS transporter [Vibrio sp. TH_r3]|uniref:MFS transporter n=1 Tax=Vibrio sp. TH_r3 TaxID=3082084 RepID=UPI002953402A|nr:MFS transporter [Vibrio sp. TH_r3]MDV7104652.1 MFS transporter [Vibrio sp. TH_r3]
MQLQVKTSTRYYLIGRFFDGISSGLFMMALPWIMLETPNMGGFVAMVAFGCTAISFVMTPVFSTFIDRCSRKKILVWVQCIQASVAAITALFYGFGYGSEWVLAAVQLVFWTSSNLAWSTNNAFTQENFEQDEYAAISGKQEIVMQATTLGAGALGVVLLDIWSMVGFSFFAAISSLIASFSYLLTPYRRKLATASSVNFVAQMKESKQIFTLRPHFYAFLMLSALSYPVLTFLTKLVPIWFSEAEISGEWFAGYNIAFGMGSLVTGLFVQRLLKLASYRIIMIVSMGAASIMLMGMSVSFLPHLLLLFTFFFGTFNALNRIARTNLMHHSISIDQRGRADGGLQMFATLAQSISYVAIAGLSYYDITQLGFLLAAGVMVCAVILMLYLNKQTGLIMEIA